MGVVLLDYSLLQCSRKRHFDNVVSDYGGLRLGRLSDWRAHRQVVP